ncbi:hypothetical protein K0U07_00500 [bacterium]|nr:hypothetical protein [bacterium]
MYLFTLNENAKIHTGKKILKKDTFSKVMEAKELMEEAKKEAEKIIEKAHQDGKEIHKKAEQDGFNKGLERFNEHIVYFDDKIKLIRHEAQKSLLPLLQKTTQRIVGEALKDHPAIVVDIVTEAIKNVTTANEVKVFVHKDDLATLEKNKETFKKLFEHLDIFLIEEREDVEKGSCIIQTEKGILNANLSSQYAALEKALQKTKK